MPTWKELADGLVGDLNLNLNPSKKAEGRNPLEIAQEYEDTFGRIHLVEALERLLRIHEVKPGEVHKKFARLIFDTVYTTNFDYLLEDAYKSAIDNVPKGLTARPYRTLVGGKQLAFHAGTATTNVIKMHGDANHIESMVITQNDYDSFIERNPVLATHLSSMLITKTPLFLGYSLTDPNFRQIRTIIEQRLGRFARKPYIVLFDATPNDIERYSRQNIYVINLETNSKSRSQALIEFFDELLENKDMMNFGNAFVEAGEPVKDEQIRSAIKSNKAATLLQSVIDICFTVTPADADSDQVYWKVIKPTVEKFGLQSLKHDELSFDASVLEDARTRILQAKLIICDVTSRQDFVMYELGIAVSNIKDVILLSRNEEDIPDELRGRQNVHIFTYQNTPEVLDRLSDDLRDAIEKILVSSPIARAKSLFNQENYDSVIVIMMTYLELHIKNFFRDMDDVSYRQNMRFAIQKLFEMKVIDSRQKTDLETWRELRNKIVHELYLPTKEEASDILRETETLIRHLASLDPKIVSNWWVILTATERNMLEDKFLKVLNKISHAEKFYEPIEVYKKMGTRGFSDKLVSMIVQSLVISGDIIRDNERKVRLSAKGKKKAIK
jgi:hypothetical protein